MNSPTYQLSRRTVNSLSCGVVHPIDPAQSVGAMGVFCHGYGASGDDLLGLANELLQVLPADQGVVLVFPEAPLSLEEIGMPGARAWWHLSVQRLLSALEDGQYELVRQEEPDGMDDARDKLVGAVGQLLEENKLDADNLLLGGFSQGAMLSMDVATRGMEQPPAAICLYSGCLICEKQWKQGATRLADCDIMQSHGALDPVLPLQTGIWLRELLVEAKCQVDFVQFQGVHTIPMEAIEKTAVMLARLLKSK